MSNARSVSKIKQFIKKQIRSIESFGIPRIPYEIVRTFPHDCEAFTQGLFFSSGYLYESTGLIGRSSLRRLDPKDGRILKKILLPKVWAEGLTLLDDQVFQLTWQSHKAIIYSFPELHPKGEISFEGEGWGLATYEKSLVMTDGSHAIYFRDKNFYIVKEIKVTMNGIPQDDLNDLAVLNEKFYVNVWYRNEILQIHPETGTVTGILDCEPLVKMARPSDPQAVLNGIACDPGTNTLFITGKCWPLMFQIQLS